MPYTTNGAVALHHDWVGLGTGPVVVLLAGAGRPSTDFDTHFCEPLTDLGFRLLRIDHRDTGRSSALIGAQPALFDVRDTARGSGHAQPPYAIADLADDIVAVMDDLGIERAHFVGRSIGGLIAQQMAIVEPNRVSSLNLIMAMSRSMADQISDATLERLEDERIASEADYIARQITVARLNGMEEDFDEARIADEARVAWRRGIHQGGTARHFAASMAIADLRPSLAKLAVPTLILHGRHDRVIPVKRAQETAAAIPGAQIEICDDMAHDGPPRLRARWGRRIAEQLHIIETWISRM